MTLLMMKIIIWVLITTIMMIKMILIIIMESYMEKEDSSPEHPIQNGEYSKQRRIL